MRVRWRIALVLAAVGVTAVALQGDGDVAEGAAVVQRLAGTGRLGTAVALSQQAYPDGTGTVVVARADAYADALAGAPLAATLDAPVLLTGSGNLSAEAEEEIDRLGADTAVLLGGENALSEQVESDLESAGVGTIRRVAGPDRFSTAALIALELVGSRTGVDTYVVEGANSEPGRGWPDAVSVAALAASARAPILLVTRDGIPPDTHDAICDLELRLTIVGGAGAVSPEVASLLGDCDDDGAADRPVGRVSGATRYETSRAVADLAVEQGFGPARTWLSTGANYPDALAAGPAAAADGAVLLLVDGASPEGLRGTPPAVQWLEGHRADLEIVRVVGGEEVLTRQLEDDVRTLIGGGGSPPPPSPSPSPTPTQAPPCAPPSECYQDPVQTGTFDSARVPEASGLAASARNPGLLYLLDDGPDTRVVEVMRPSGELLGALTVGGLDGVDTEGLAVGPCGPGDPVTCVYVGDIGDNRRSRQSVRIHRFVEPDLSAGVPGGPVGADSIELRYPDGAHNAEALLIDRAGTPHILTKGEHDGGTGATEPARLYAAPGYASGQMIDHGEVPVPPPNRPRATSVTGNVVTGADVLDGSVLVRTYDAIVEYVPPRPDAPLAELGSWASDEVPSPTLPQSEAVAWAFDACGYYTVSEQVGEIWFVACRNPAATGQG